jgi:hypothetical protein
MKIMDIAFSVVKEKQSIIVKIAISVSVRTVAILISERYMSVGNVKVITLNIGKELP